MDSKQKISDKVTTVIDFRKQVTATQQAALTHDVKVRTKQTKFAYKKARRQYKLSKQQYKKMKRVKDKRSQDLLKQKNVLKQHKIEQDVHKKVYKYTRKKDPRSVRNRVKRTVENTQISLVNSYKYRLLEQEETLSEKNKLNRQAIQREKFLHLTKKTGKAGIKVGIRSGKTVYNITDRTHNLVRGKGLKKTPKKLSTIKQRMRRWQKFRNRLLNSPAAKQLKRVGNWSSWGIRVLNNPFKSKNLVVLALFGSFLGIIIGITSMTAPAIQQTDADLNKTWLYLTQLDAEHSTNKVVFYTNIDDVLFYTNFTEGMYQLDGLKGSTNTENSSNFPTYREYLLDLWYALNGQRSPWKITSMDQLMSDDGKWNLSREEQQTIQELRKNIGYRTLSGQLQNPFDNSESLLITRRFGYEKRGEEVILNEGSDFLVDADTAFKAPLNGTVRATYGSEKIVIENQSQRLTISGVDGSRFSSGGEIKTGEYLGNTKRTTLFMTYELKFKEDSNWQFVNVGFYFPTVKYTQSTILASNLDVSEDVLERAQIIYDYLTAKGFSREGIAGILGNFYVESNINPKRAEGDYLSPPIGAYEGSYDNESWLNIGGASIYNGAFPNIIHRGLGLGQWTDTADGSTRQTLLRNFAHSKGKKWYDLILQLDFMFYGDVAYHQTILNRVGNRSYGSTVPELTIAFLKFWEGNPGDKVKERIQAAVNWYQYFSNNNLSLEVSGEEVFKRYKQKFISLPTEKELRDGWEGNGYALGNCTWYVYNRMKQFGKTIYSYMGNANQWVYNYNMTEGASLVSSPQVGDIVIFTGSSYGAYGHVGVVEAVLEAVLEDETIILSEMNINGEYSFSYRAIQKGFGVYFMRVN